MTELRRRMIESPQLRGMSERTQEMYVRAARQLAQHDHKSPDLIAEEELRRRFLFIKQVKKYSRSASTIAICGIKFFFEHTLRREWSALSGGASRAREEAARRPQPGGGAPDSRRDQTPALPSLLIHHLLLWPAPAGGRSPSGSRHRQRPDGHPRPSRERQQGSLCPLASADPHSAPASIGSPIATPF